MKIRNFASSSLAAFLIAAGAYNSHAQSLAPANDVPRAISYQGTLADNYGKALPDGSYRITLSLFADPAGSVKVWQDTYDALVINGIFNLYLGAGSNPLPDPARLNAALWIGTQVGDGPLMHPLTPLSASPYALNVPDRAITTGKLADGAVTADKVDMNYIAGVQINDREIAGTGTVLKLKGSDAITLDYDETTNSVTIGAGNGVERGTSGDAEKGSEVLDITYLTSFNWLGRDAGSTPPSYDVPNTTSSMYNTLGGGQSNVVRDNTFYTVIAGGRENQIGNGNDYGAITGGYQNSVFADYSFIGGGQSNVAATSFGGTNAVIGGGESNATGGDHAFIGGGEANQGDGDWSVIGGGTRNNISANLSSIVGGSDNVIQSQYSLVGGGESNDVFAAYGVIAGGKSNTIEANYSAIGGGYGNEIESVYGTIGGGELNLITESAYGTIGGGYNHQIIGVNYGTVGGGDRNRLVGDYGTVAGGSYNILNADLGFIGGGAVNQVDAQYSAIGGGNENWARGEYSAIGGGYRNTLDGNYSAVPGGDNVKTTGYAQTATGFFNAPRGFLTSIPTTAAKATNNDPLFMVGNGTPTTAGGTPTRSNAFEVSYNGHSVVYDVNGTTRNPIVGATYVDNILYAWGDINGGGGINSDFGVVSVTHAPFTGVYNVRLDVRDPVTGAPVILTSGSVTATLTELGESTPCAFIHCSRIGAYAPNEFRVRIRDANCQPLDAHFMFKVTGRP